MFIGGLTTEVKGAGLDIYQSTSQTLQGGTFSIGNTGTCTFTLDSISINSTIAFEEGGFLSFIGGSTFSFTS